jgi:hypothetical protein
VKRRCTPQLRSPRASCRLELASCWRRAGSSRWRGGAGSPGRLDQLEAHMGVASLGQRTLCGGWA